MPTFRSARISDDENGITAHGSTNASTTRYGAVLNSVGSESSGMMSSLQTCFTPSASHCRKPLGPTRLGPTRDWIRAHTRRSTQLTIPANGNATPRNTTALSTKITITATMLAFLPKVPALTRFSIRVCMMLPIDLRRDHVETRDQSNQVRDHQAPAEFLNDTHRRKRSRPHVHPPWISGAIADDVPSHVAARALDADLTFARGRFEIARHLSQHRSG